MLGQNLSWIMPLSVALSSFGALNGIMFASGRICLVASRCFLLDVALGFKKFQMCLILSCETKNNNINV